MAVVSKEREREARREERRGVWLWFWFAKVFNVLNEKLIAKFALTSVCLDFWGLAYIRDSLSKLSSPTLLERPIYVSDQTTILWIKNLFFFFF